MRDSTLWASFSVAFIICVVIGGKSTAFAVDSIIVKQDTTTIPSVLCPAPDNNTTVCVNIAGTRDGLTFAPVTGACTTMETCARVAITMNDGAGDTLQIANTRITNNSGADKTFTLLFYQENLAKPPTGTPWYNTYVSGEFGPVALNKIVSAKTFVKWGTGTYQQAGSTLTYTVSCLPDLSCLTVFSKKTGAQKSVGTLARGIKGELVITLKVNSYVELETSNGDHGHKIISSTTPPDGTTVVGENAIEGDCPGCTPSSQLSVICSTTYSTAKMFGCPSCVTEDGQVAANAKVRLFASTNRENLAHDMARGEGEYLASLAMLFHIPAHEQPGFLSSAQEEYRTLNGQEDRAVDQVVAALQERAKTYHASAAGY
jgi:hypothetical protein